VPPRRVDPSNEPSTIAAMDAVMQRAYGVASFRTSLDRFAAAQPDGLAVVEEAGAVIGAGCCVANTDGGFGWIGLVATEPGAQRRGIGTAITTFLSEVLAEHGCASVLDASAAGGPVYERMGFADCGVTRVFGFDGEADGGARSTSEPSSCKAFTASDFDDVVAFDGSRFGASRPALLAKLMEQHGERALVLRRATGLTGYLVAQETTLGPVIADDRESLSALISASLRLDWSVAPRINVPPESVHLEALSALGFNQRRQLRHMRRGIDQLPGHRDRIAGSVSLGEG
jgi:GNAT superfamily N-acetyltransferase